MISLEMPKKKYLGNKSNSILSSSKITMSDNEIFVSKVFSYKHSISVKVDISDKENIKENVCIY